MRPVSAASSLSRFSVNLRVDRIQSSGDDFLDDLVGVRLIGSLRFAAKNCASLCAIFAPAMSNYLRLVLLMWWGRQLAPSRRCWDGFGESSACGRYRARGPIIDIY
jgi:hypothetical protein